MPILLPPHGFLLLLSLIFIARFFMFLLVAILTSLVAQSLGLLIGAAVNVEVNTRLLSIILQEVLYWQTLAI